MISCCGAWNMEAFLAAAGIYGFFSVIFKLMKKYK